MSEISESVLDAFKKRTTSAAVGTYLFFWASFHWQGIYTTLFVSEDKIYAKYGLLKNEYVNKYFFGFHVTSLSWYLGYIVPLIFTVLFIWPLPKYVLIHFYEKEQEHKTERMRIKFREEQKRKNFEISSIRREEVRVKAKTSLAKEKKTAAKADPKIVWEEEYKKFEKDPAFESFTQILQSVYEHTGKTSTTDLYGQVNFEVAGGTLLLADTMGLVSIAANGDIKLTDKGKYFASRYPHYGQR